MFSEFWHHVWLDYAVMILGASLALLAGTPAAAGDVGLGEWGSFGIAEPGRFSHPQYLAADGDLVYVSDLGNKRIQVFDVFGQYVSEWGSSGKFSGNFHYPSGVAAYNGSVFVADRDLHKVQKFTTNGTFILEWGTRGSGPGQFLLPGDIAIHEGLVYVVDTGNQRVQVFDGDGAYISAIGSSGLGPGQLLNPLGIDTDARGYIYVADRGNSKVEKFHPNGTLAASFPFHYYGYEFRPASVAIDPDGGMYILNSATGRVMHLQQDADLLVGVREQNGPYGLKFAATDVEFGPNGQLLVTDYDDHVLRVFETPFYIEPELVTPEDLTEDELVVFFDTTRPEITVPGPVRAEAVDYRTAVYIGTANATDASGIMDMMSTAPETFKPGETTVLWTARDNAGYTASAEQKVTVYVCGKHTAAYNMIRGTDGNDLIEGTDGDDLVFGMGGNDLIIGGGGDDCIFGGHGADIISGGDGDDVMRGNAGNDVLKGGGGSDVIHTGDGYDVADGGDGADTCHPSGPNDVLVGCE